MPPKVIIFYVLDDYDHNGVRVAVAGKVGRVLWADADRWVPALGRAPRPGDAFAYAADGLPKGAIPYNATVYPLLGTWSLAT